MSKTAGKDLSLGECLETNCKQKSKRFNFCLEHFDQFKFGAIKKDGTHPTDYERKIDHYSRHKKALGSL